MWACSVGLLPPKPTKTAWLLLCCCWDAASLNRRALLRPHLHGTQGHNCIGQCTT